MIEYESVIVDELGHVVAECGYFSDEELDDILEKHPEWRITCVERK